MRDLAEVDTLATRFLWRHPEVATTILRPVNTLGYYVHSTIGRYLRQRYVPTIMGFNPMMQFIHEEDVAEAVALALQIGHARRLQRHRSGRRPAQGRGPRGRRHGACRFPSRSRARSSASSSAGASTTRRRAR